MQAVKYESQLEYKKNYVLEALHRIGGFTNVTIDSVNRSNPSYHYRNKAQFPVVQTDKGVEFGFYAPNSHRVVTNGGLCPLQDKRTTDVATAVCEWATANKISVYDEETCKGLLRKICIRTGKDEAVLVLVATKILPHTQALTEKLTGLFPFLKGIVVNINTDRKNNRHSRSAV